MEVKIFLEMEVFVSLLVLDAGLEMGAVVSPSVLDVGLEMAVAASLLVMDVSPLAVGFSWGHWN